MSFRVMVEYIWIDGAEPVRQLRSKTKVAKFEELPTNPEDFPDWGFDGSSTNQAEGSSSDCALKPVFFVKDPIREGDVYTVEDGGINAEVEIPNYLVLCEVMNADGTPHATNARAKLRAVLEQGADKLEAWFGLEQEYTLFKGSQPLGFPGDRRYPGAQGPYYCGVGADEVYGRELVDAHMRACIDADLEISGINAEVMPGQWEFQIGPCGPLAVGDHIWVARWLLYRLGEDFGINATLDAKPVPGDWNGAGMHTNFSTAAMRAAPAENDPFAEELIESASGNLGMAAINEWCEKAGQHVADHLAAYGDNYEARLTGKHETCRFDQFKFGVSDRTASIRIPMATDQAGYGYLEDRRPNANACPYEVAAVMLKTAADLW